MGLFNKLMFWKKDEDSFDFDNFAEKEMGNPDPLDVQQDDLGMQEKSSFPETPSPTFPIANTMPPLSPSNYPTTTTGSSNGSQRDLELINSKLDTIKAILQSLDQRLAHVERSSGVEKKKEQIW